MDQIDEFASVFRRAEREPFIYEDMPLARLTLVTDRDVPHAETVRDDVLRFLPDLPSGDKWRLITAADFADVTQLLENLETQPCDLLVTYRHLHEQALVPQHSLGVFLDILTQATEIPVLVLPGTANMPVPLRTDACQRVMVVTGHISGQNRLINFGAAICEPGNELWLCHIEDDAIFERYMRAIERIPDIHTEQARSLILDQLLKDATDFIDTCIEELRRQRPELIYHSTVTVGHRLQEYCDLTKTHSVDLLVANTKDAEQLAMHGMAYSIAVELIDIPLLLL